MMKLDSNVSIWGVQLPTRTCHKTKEKNILTCMHKVKFLFLNNIIDTTTSHLQVSEFCKTEIS